MLLQTLRDLLFDISDLTPNRRPFTSEHRRRIGRALEDLGDVADAPLPETYTSESLSWRIVFAHELSCRLPKEVDGGEARMLEVFKAVLLDVNRHLR